MVDKPVAMISSTSRTLPEHRAEARDACLRADFFPKMMEHLPPSPKDALRLSYDLVDEADVYVLILGVRYGEVPPGHEKSYTHLEFERAVERGVPRLVLLMDRARHPVLPDDVETGVGAQRLAEFRARVARAAGAATFASKEDLRAKLVHGLSVLRADLRRAAPSVHYVRQLTRPPEPYVAHPYTLLQTSGVIGRQRELNALTDWITGAGSAAAVLAFVAIGGMGKSAVTWKWFHDVAPQEMRPLAGRVWWSFYESDARFANFVTRTLAYVTGRPVGSLAGVPPPEQEDELIGVLDRDPHLVVLDGLERLLLAYARPDAAHLADDDLDERTADVVAGALGLPAGAAASYTGQSRLRVAADPRVGAFLRRLATVRASRILVSTRLYPAELQTVTGAPVPGAAAYFLAGLTPDDAVNLWRALGVSGSRHELRSLFATFGNYPLVIRALAGEVARFRAAPGDFDAWRAAHPDFDPYREVSLVQRRSHVLAHALAGLTEAETRTLHVVAAFRMPATIDALTALLLGPGRPFGTEAELDSALADLEDRGLLGWDRVANRYDLHPVVRGVAWSALDRPARTVIYEDLASHLGALPEPDDESEVTADDLSGVIEYFHTLVQLGRAADAVTVFHARISDPLARLGLYRDLAELLELLTGRDEMFLQLTREDREMALVVLVASHELGGEPNLALDRHERLAHLGFVDPENRPVFVPALRLLSLVRTGRLVEAELAARDALADGSLTATTVLAIGVLRAVRTPEDAEAWLTDHHVGADLEGWVFGGLHAVELARLALRRGDLDGARRWTAEVDRLAQQDSTRQRRIQVAALTAALERVPARAAELLATALVEARTARLQEDEVTLLLQLARLELAGGDRVAARTHLAEAEVPVERGGLRLLAADLHNLRSELELAEGDRSAAADAAERAFRAAWCDGPPFAYADGLAAARANLAAAGAGEPTGLPTVPPPTDPLPYRPTGVDEALGVALDQEHGDVAGLLTAHVRAAATAETPLLARAAAAATPATRAALASALAGLPVSEERERLLGVLATDPDGDVRLAAVQALGDAAAQRAAFLLELAGSDAAEAVRERAAWALTSPAVQRALDPAAVVELFDRAADAEVRAAAAVTLHGLGADGVLRDRAVSAPDPAVRTVALVVLSGLPVRSADVDGDYRTGDHEAVRIDGPLRQFLLDRMFTDEPEVSSVIEDLLAISAVRGPWPAADVDRLRRIAADPDPGRRDPVSALALLWVLGEDVEDEVRRRAVDSPTASWRVDLLDLLGHGVRWLLPRDAVREARQEPGRPDAALRRFLLDRVRADPEEGPRRAALWHLRRALEPPAPDVTDAERAEILRTALTVVQQASNDLLLTVAVDILTMLGGDRSAVVQRARTDPDPGCRESLLRILAGEAPELDAPDGDALWELLAERAVADPDTDVRTTAVLLLGEDRAERTWEFLIARLADAPDPDWPVIAEAVLLATPGLSPVEVDLLDRELRRRFPAPAPDLPPVGWLSVVAALPADRRADLALRPLLQDGPAEVRALALGLLLTAEEPDGAVLFSQDLDGQEPFLDPARPVTAAFADLAARRLGREPAAVRRAYEELAGRYGLVLEWVSGPVAR